jgi:hypothetical protein
MMIGTDTDPWGGDRLTEAQAGWREREQRQRSVRLFMMFLLMMLLMDGEEQNQRRRSTDGNNLRKKSKSQSDDSVQSIYMKRRDEDNLIQQTVQKHPRYKHLIEKNHGKNYEYEITRWADAQLELERDEFVSQAEQGKSEEQKDQEEEEKAFHYPWNATGFYRGEWVRDESQTKTASENQNITIEKKQEKKAHLLLNAVETEESMLKILQAKQELIGVYLLPSGTKVKMQNEPETGNDKDTSSSFQHKLLRGGTESNYKTITRNYASNKLQVTLRKASGRAAFQLYSRSVPAMKEISILDGFLKLYDSDTVGYSSRRDILLRVSGVIIHSLGRISLVSNASPGRSAFVINNDQGNHLHQRLLEALEESDFPDAKIKQISDSALDIFKGENDADKPFYERIYQSSITSSGGAFMPRTLEALAVNNNITKEKDFKKDATIDAINTMSEKDNEIVDESEIKLKPAWSKFVIPYPFVRDDEEQTIRRMRTPAARSMPPREQQLEANAGDCEFEITMDTREEEWGLNEWRKLINKETVEILEQKPDVRGDENIQQSNEIDNHDGSKIMTTKETPSSKSSNKIHYQNLVITMNGTIDSPNCNFTAHLNTTALRTDWEHTTGRAINYSFYMMLTCLTQIVLLLRQLLHTQAQSAAAKVSLLCVGWQTLLDALLCLIHTYLSLAMQPAFTAFASVAFFKLILFCVLEMKYMAIIIQARNANGNGNTTELLRQQIAMLHLRFYVALICIFIIFFFAWESYHRFYILALYSFWVPQIIQNVATDTKRPLHHYYVYGMSLTRLVAPLFIFLTPNNFLKEVYPDIPTDTTMCELLILWVGFQTVILETQGRYGARFMIPARFLPPKFEYSRPIPASLLPSCDQELTPSESLKKERVSISEVQTLLPLDSCPHSASGGTRNRMKSRNRAESSMTSEIISAPCSHSSPPTFDCVICYNDIDVRDRRGYMLAPCDHIFHRSCLEKWMEIKMECPVCRTSLPPL